MLLTISEAAERLGFSEKTLYRWAGKKIPVVRFGRSMRFRPDDIEAAINGGLQMEQTNLRTDFRKSTVVSSGRRGSRLWE